MSTPMHRLARSGPGARLCSPGLPDCWGSRGDELALGHEDGVLLLGPDAARWCPLDGVVAVDGTGAGWTALTEDEDGVATAWALSETGWVPRAQVAGGPAACRLEGGALVERRGPRRLVARIVSEPAVLDLPLGAERGRVAVAADGIAWADGPDLYRRQTGARPRTAGQAPGPVTRLQCGPGGALLATIGDDRSLLVPSGPGRPRLVSEASDEPAVLGEAHVLLQIGEDVLELPWREGEERWHRGRMLCGSPDLLLDPDEARVVDRSGAVVLDGLLPAAATASEDAVLGPGGRTWPRSGAEPGPVEPALLAEHLLAHEGHVLAVLDGEARVRTADGRWSEARPLPSPFDDPDELLALRPSRGGVVLVGEEERIHRAWSGAVRRGLVPRSRRAPGPPRGWHWNDAGLLLRLH